MNERPASQRTGKTESKSPYGASPLDAVAASASPTASKTPHFVWIDVLRGLAALAVVLYHVRVDLWVGLGELRSHPELYSSFDRNLGLITFPLQFFGSGVMLFFLLSGFCVHLPQSRKKELFFGPYMVRRLLRLYPPYFVAILFTLLAEWACRRVAAAPLTPWPAILQNVLMLHNYAPFTAVKAAPGVQNPSLWSLPVEVELYLAYPVFWFLLRRFNIAFALGCAALVTGIAAMAYHSGVQTAGNFAQYWIIWCAGAWLAERATQQKIPVWKPVYWAVPTVCLLIAVAMKLRHISLPIEDLVWAVGYFFVLWWGLIYIKAPAASNRVASAFKWLGTISYSLYLIHYPFFIVSGALWRSMWGTKPANLLVPLGFVMLSIGLASAFYLLFEAPTHRLARLLSSPKLSTPVS